MLQVTMITAAFLALVNVWLGGRVGQVRGREKIMMGDAGSPSVLSRMRAQANFAEYVPLPVILMGLIEMTGGSRTGLIVAGAVLFAGRIIHPFGMERPAPNPLRLGGALATLAASLGLAAWALAIAYR